MTRRPLLPKAFAISLLAGIAALPACNIVGPIVAVAQGPGEVEAVYELDPDRKTVIFVDDPANKIAQRRTRASIGESCQQALMRKKKVREANMIDTRSALAAAANGDDDLSITEIGEAVGAEVIIYALVTRFELSGDGADFDPTAEIEVKIFDVTTHSRLWPPAGQPGYRSKFSSAGANRYMPQSRTDLLRAQNELALITGEGMSQLFYDVERPQSLRKQ
jgi:hypothetical protein